MSTDFLSKKLLGKLIKKIRNANNLTQAAFGKFFEPTVTQPTVARWEKGEQMPDRRHFPKIAFFLNITFEELLELIETSENKPESLKIENKTLNPNKRHLSIINRGVKAWNLWRLKNPDAPPELCGAKNLPSQLSKINLSNANLRGTNLNNINLSGANLLGADIRGATLNNVDLSDGNLREANFSRAILKDCCFFNANLEKIDFSYTFFPNTDLRETNMNRANLSGANLSFSKVHGVSTWNVNVQATEQKQLNISPQLEEPIFVDDIRFAYIKALQLEGQERLKEYKVTKDFQDVIKSENRRFEKILNLISNLIIAN